MNLSKLHTAIAATAPIDGVGADGTISFQSTATDAQKSAALAVMTAYFADPVGWLASHKTSGEAWADGAEYINQFFSADQRQMLIARMILGNDAQKADITAIFGWIASLESAAMTTPTTFDPSAFGEPPYTYADVIATI